MTVASTAREKLYILPLATTLLVPFLKLAEPYVELPIFQPCAHSDIPEHYLFHEWSFLENNARCMKTLVRFLDFIVDITNSDDPMSGFCLHDPVMQAL